METPDSITPIFLLVIFVAAPLMSIRTYYRLKENKPLPEKRKRFLGMMISALLMWMPAVISANAQGLELFPRRSPSAWSTVFGLAFLTLFGIRLNKAWHRITAERKQQARKYLPENPSELPYWLGISVLAGVSEEYCYRGVAPAALVNMGVSQPLAMLACILAFGAAHTYQGWRGALGTGVIGAFFQVMVLWTGSLYLAMSVHVLYDMLVGFVAMKLLAKESAAAALDTQPAS